MDKEILRPSQKAGIDKWPRGCPLDPEIDLWGKHERQKQRKRGSGTLWTCGLCGKVFKSEHYLDLHLEHKHMNETPRGGVCLADYCDMFDACAAENKVKKRPKHGEAVDCDTEAMEASRHRCEEAMRKCFPLDSEASRKLHVQYTKQYCRVLDCKVRAEQRQEETSDLMPVIVLLILILLICFIVFSIVVCCVDYSDDILRVLADSGLASKGFVKKVMRTRDQTRATVGLDRTKCI